MKPLDKIEQKEKLTQEEYEALCRLINNRVEAIDWIPNMPKDMIRNEKKNLQELRDKLFRMFLEDENNKQN